MVKGILVFWWDVLAYRQRGTGRSAFRFRQLTLVPQVSKKPG
jgi:hypothetical protein